VGIGKNGVAHPQSPKTQAAAFPVEEAKSNRRENEEKNAGFAFGWSADCESAVAIPTSAYAFSEGEDRLRAHRNVCSVRPAFA